MEHMENAGAPWLDTLKVRCEQNKLVAQSMPDPERERSLRIEQVRMQSELPDRFRLSAFVNFAVEADNLEAFTAVRAFVERSFKPPGVGLYGSVGTGKTRLLCAAANAAIMAEKRVVVLTTTELALRLKATFQTRDDSEYSLIQRLVRTPVLILDDLGKEQITEWSAQNLFEFFNARYNTGLPLLVAANQNLADLKRTKYASVPEGVDPDLMLAVLDRIREMTGPWIAVGGKSKRRMAS